MWWGAKKNVAAKFLYPNNIWCKIYRIFLAHKTVQTKEFQWEFCFGWHHISVIHFHSMWWKREREKNIITLHEILIRSSHPFIQPFFVEFFPPLVVWLYVASNRIQCLCAHVHRFAKQKLMDWHVDKVLLVITSANPENSCNL